MSIKLACLFLLMTSCAAVADAGFMYSLELEAQGNINPGTIQVDPASVTTVSVFLRETVYGTDTLRLNNPNWGMATANFGVTRTGTGSNSITGVAKNPLFDLNTSLLFDSASASFPLSVDAISPLVLGDTGSISTSRLILGSFDVTAGSAGDSALFSFAPLVGGQNFTLGDDLSPDGAPVYLDGFLGTLPSLTISAVPEPISVLLFGMAGIGGITARRWGKRRQKLYV